MNKDHCISEIKNVLHKIYTPKDNSLNKLLNQIEFKRINKGEIFQEQFTLATEIGMLVQGTLIVKRFEQDGTDNVVYFNTVEKTPFVGVLESLIRNEKSSVEIKALEDSWIGVIKYQSLLELYKAHHELECLGRKVLEVHYLLALEQGRFRQNKEAAEKQKIAQSEFPRIFELCEKKDLANYIGVAPSTYSRLGRRIKNKIKNIRKN